MKYPIAMTVAALFAASVACAEIVTINKMPVTEVPAGVDEYGDEYGPGLKAYDRGERISIEGKRLYDENYEFSYEIKSAFALLKGTIDSKRKVYDLDGYDVSLRMRDIGEYYAVFGRVGDKNGVDIKLSKLRKNSDPKAEVEGYRLDGMMWGNLTLSKSMINGWFDTQILSKKTLVAVSCMMMMLELEKAQEQPH